MGGCAVFASCKADASVPVSYTHLDVYKRQVKKDKEGWKRKQMEKKES